MTPAELQARLKGVIAFCPTPFGEEGELELRDLAAQVEFLAETPASAIVVCGGVGEFYALDGDEQRAVTETGVAAAGGRVPVLVGIGAATREACRLAEHAAQTGAAGVLVNPLHFIEPELEGLRRHYAAITAASGLGTIVFSHRQARYDLRALHELAALDGVVGLKDEFGDLRTFIQARSEIGSALAWINGTGESLAASYFAAGAAAMTSGIVNFAPELTFAVWNAGAEGRMAEVGELVARYVAPLTSLRERRPGYSTTVVKEAMNLRGRPGGFVRPPLVPMRRDEREELERVLATLRALAAPDLPAFVDR